MNKQNRGITLVALVITIIVLIILAAVSINAVMNDGLIENAKEATGDYKTKQTEEIISLAYLTALTKNGGNSDATNFATDFEAELTESEITDVTANVDGTFKVVVDDVTYNVDSNGKVEKVEIVTFEIANTTYQAEEGMTWEQWISSSYNIGQVFAYDGFGGVVYGDGSTYTIRVKELAQNCPNFHIDGDAALIDQRVDCGCSFYY